MKPRSQAPGGTGENSGTDRHRRGNSVMPPHSARALVIALALCLPACAQFTESRTANYSVFYQPGYEKDLEFARTWLERAEALLKQKYGVPFTGYHIDVYLYSEPKPGADTSTANLKCCSGIGAPKTGVISFLAPSAPVWKDFHGLTSLRLPKDENYQGQSLDVGVHHGGPLRCAGHPH
jgi:hypothetical protein